MADDSDYFAILLFSYSPGIDQFKIQICLKIKIKKENDNENFFFFFKLKIFIEKDVFLLNKSIKYLAFLITIFIFVKTNIKY
ncbi:unknown [Tannerella sp. CAG:51]|jgi:hypothetical protein|nr:unknown [Tannerella sp. CAG:51]